MVDALLEEPIVIRFDGLDADHHQLELTGLAESLSGLSRIIATSGHFALTQEVSLRKDKQSVRVVVSPPQDGCFLVHAFIQFAHHHPMFGIYEVEAAAGLTVTAIAYIFARAAGKKEEMKLLSRALESSIRELGSRDQPTIDRLLTTVEHMADGLRPAVKRAVTPIGSSAHTLTVGTATSDHPARVDEADKAAIMSPAGLTVDEERSYVVLISELDMQNGACHVAIDGEDQDTRFPARITDPAFTLPKNPYVMTMAEKSKLAVRAKATYRDGQIDRLFISNFEDRARGEPDFELR